jgi:glycosyltransferase involved in cell wall biosynthesis
MQARKIQANLSRMTGSNGDLMNSALCDVVRDAADGRYGPSTQWTDRSAPARPVRVCIDGRMLDVKGGTGVATYASVLHRCLMRAGVTPECLFDHVEGDPGRGQRLRAKRWLAAVDHRPRTGTAERPGRWSVPDVFREAQVYFDLHGRLLPVRCPSPPEVMHWTYPVPLFMEGARNIYTVHDLIPLLQPELTDIRPNRHRKLLHAIVQQASHVVTVSMRSRLDLIELLGCAEDFVSNTWQAVLTPLQRDPALPRGLRPGQYLLYCGSIEPRKNLSRLIEAYRAARAASTASLRPLVIAGPDGWRASEIRALIGDDPWIVELPWVERPALIGLIRQARALLFPSLAEGFGLPVAEAMTLGTPVMTTGLGALAEVAGDAALLIDPLDHEALRDAIMQLDGDDVLCRRLRAAGFDQARQFSAHAYGERLQRLYASVMARPEGTGA